MSGRLARLQSLQKITEMKEFLDFMQDEGNLDVPCLFAWLANYFWLQATLTQANILSICYASGAVVCLTLPLAPWLRGMTLLSTGNGTEEMHNKHDKGLIRISLQVGDDGQNACSIWKSIWCLPWVSLPTFVCESFLSDLHWSFVFSVSGEGEELGMAGLQSLVWRDSIQMYLRGADSACVQVSLLCNSHGTQTLSSCI